MAVSFQGTIHLGQWQEYHLEHLQTASTDIVKGKTLIDYTDKGQIYLELVTMKSIIHGVLYQQQPWDRHHLVKTLKYVKWNSHFGKLEVGVHVYNHKYLYCSS